MAKKTKIVEEEHILSGKNKVAIKQHVEAQPGKNQSALRIVTDDNVNIQRGLYSDELLPKLEALCAKGLSNSELAKGLGIGNRTFYEWLKKYPQFLFAIYKYRGVADIFVENALYNNAVGYSYQEEMMAQSGKVVMVTRFQPGSVAAQKFYLVNRMKDRYKNKIEAEVTVLNDISALNVNIRRRGDD